jgi:nucleoside-diphosphate-sugar epimerase
MSSGVVVVTGAAGLVGKAVCSVLEGNGVDVLPIIRPGSDPRLGMLCDLTQPDAFEQLEGPVAAIVHLAAAVPMAAEFPDTEEIAALTRAMDANVLGLAKRFQCPVLYASSCGLYRKDWDLPKVEESDDVLDPCTPYLRAKLDGERMFLSYGNAVIMRISAPIGPGMRKTAIASRFIEQARSGNSILLWGAGGRRQNFIAVADIGRFVWMVLSNGAQGIFNVAAPCSTSMRELAEIVIDVVGAGRIEYAEQPDPNEHHKADYDTSKAERVLGWVASTQLTEQLAVHAAERFRK